jgi:hypothetical protein
MIAKAWRCEFADRDDNRRVIVVDLRESEIEAARVHAFPEIAAKAYALRRAYLFISAEKMHHVAVEPVCMS